MIDELNHFFITQRSVLYIINLTAVLPIFWVYVGGGLRKIENKLFCLLTIAFLTWINGGYFFAYSEDLGQAILLGRLLLGMVFISLVILYIFLGYFPEKDEKIISSSRLIISLSAIIFFLIVFTNLVVRNVELTKWGMNPVYHPIGSIFFYILLIFLVVFIFKRIFKKYFTLRKIEKLKIQYFLIGLFIFLLMNLVFNVFLPLSRGTIQYWQFGNYSVIFLLGFTAYAIVKRELFDVKVALTSVFIGLIALLLFLDILIFTEELWLRVAKGGILAMFLGFGWLLIKSVTREIEQRERLAEAYIKLQQLGKAKTEFLSIASHQLRTPLTTIKGYISMMLEKTYGAVPEKMTRPLESIYTSNERLIKLVNDLLNISRIEAGRIEINIEKLAPEEVIKEAIDDLKPIAKEKNLYLKFEEPEKPLPKISLDKEKIRQVIMNIMDNAIKYTEHGGATVKLQSIDHKLQIIISDTGDGLSREEIPHLFTSFTRGKAGTRLWVEGAGLGLYIAKRFVEMHNGKIWAESPGRGRGSIFYIELPIEFAEKKATAGL
jgi:signal transduction histidine kinase